MDKIRPQGQLIRLPTGRTNCMFGGVSDEVKTSASGELAHLRSRIAGCELVVLVDVSTRTVLAWDGALKLPQENLDDLCELASEIFAGNADDPDLDTAVMTRPTGIRTFVRSAEDQAEVLCSVLSATADVPEALDRGRSFFRPTGSDDPARVH